MSAGNSASKSSTRTIPPAFSRNTISSPRRKISTSELLTRNFFGILTAWLFPDLNTRAMAMICLPDIYTSMYIHLQAPIFELWAEQRQRPLERRCSSAQRPPAQNGDPTREAGNTKDNGKPSDARRCGTGWPCLIAGRRLAFFPLLIPFRRVNYAGTNDPHGWIGLRFPTIFCCTLTCGI